MLTDAGLQCLELARQLEHCQTDQAADPILCGLRIERLEARLEACDIARASNRWYYLLAGAGAGIVASSVLLIFTQNI